MKTLPTVVASNRRKVSISIDEFEGMERAPRRDAFDFFFRARAIPTGDLGLLVVRFSGTVMGAQTTDFGLPHYEERLYRFLIFSEAAMGDALDDKGEVPITLEDPPIQTIDCFSPHFQTWYDRPTATDEEVERHINAHIIAAWEFNQPSWRFGPSDLLRLKRAWPDCLRLINLHDGHQWTLSDQNESAVTITPLNNFLRDQLRQREIEMRPPVAPIIQDQASESQPMPAIFVYVDESRIADLRSIEAAHFDLRKLIALCGELNQCYRAQCYHAVAALTRSLIDHVPPIFNCRSFTEVANNYPGTRSFKSSMKHLDTAARAIADQHLHTQVRNREVLPNRVQVDFSQIIDVLLAEIVRLLQPRNSDTP